MISNFSHQKSPSFQWNQRYHSPTLNLEYVEIIDRGSYGTICKARSRNAQREKLYAIKVLRKPASEKERTLQQNEVDTHLRVRGHAHIIWLDQVFVIEECTRLVLEYCPDGNLYTNIRLFQTSFMIKAAILQLISAVEHCHSLGVYHQDLKPQNVLVFNGGLLLKLADFGLATKAAESRNVRYGTHAYMSPGKFEHAHTMFLLISQQSAREASSMHQLQMMSGA